MTNLLLDEALADPEGLALDIIADKEPCMLKKLRDPLTKQVV